MSSRQSGATRDLSHKVDFSPFGHRPLVRDDKSHIKPLWGQHLYHYHNINADTNFACHSIFAKSLAHFAFRHPRGINFVYAARD